MGEPTVLDRTHNIILKTFVDTGVAPHFTETSIAAIPSPHMIWMPSHAQYRP